MIKNGVQSIENVKKKKKKMSLQSKSLEEQMLLSEQEPKQHSHLQAGSGITSRK